MRPTPKHYLQLMRWPNLLLVAATQFVVYKFVFATAFRQIDLSPALSPLQWLALSLATLCITASGYIINDLYDEKTDRINRPEKILIGQVISEKTARKIYAALLLAGSLPALWLALEIGPFYYILLYPLGAASLWLYSSHLKRLGWPGNLLVSLFCAGVTAIVWLAEQSSWLEFSRQQSEAAHALRNILLLYLLFAFISNLYREWLKDLQDYEGDRQSRRLTLPVRLGQNKARLFTFGIGLLFLLSVLAFGLQLYLQHHLLAMAFLSSSIVLPLAYSLLTLFRSHKKKHYKRQAQIAKFIMLAGVLLLVLL